MGRVFRWLAGLVTVVALACAGEGGAVRMGAKVGTGGVPSARHAVPASPELVSAPPAAPVSSVGPADFVPSGSGSSVYGRATTFDDDRDPLALRLERVLQDLVTAGGGTPPPVDAGLARVARDVARAGTAADVAFQQFLLAHHGVPEPDVELQLLRASVRPDADLETLVRHELATLGNLTGRPVSGVGVGVVRTAQGVVVGLVLRERGLVMDPVPRRIHDGQTVPLRFRPPSGFRSPQVVIQTPQGRMGRMPVSLKAGTARSELHCGDGPGRYQVELLGDGPQGPTVLANFPVYCGTDPPIRFTLQADPTGAPSDPRAIEAALLDAINRDRARAALPPLVHDDRLRAVARRHSLDMARRGVVAHRFDDTGDAVDRLRAAGHRPRLVMENVGSQSAVLSSSDRVALADLGPRASDIHHGFMASPGHRGNVLHPAATHVGIAIEAGTDARGTTWYVTQLFAAF